MLIEVIYLKKRTLIRLFSYVFSERFRYGIGLAGLTLIRTMTQIFEIIILKIMFDSITSRDISGFLQILLYIGALFFIVILLQPLFSFVFYNASIRITSKIRKDVFEHLFSLPLPYFEEHHSGDLMSRLTNDIGTLEQLYTIQISGFCSSLLTGVISLIYLYILDWRLLLFSVLSGILIIFINVRCIRPIYELSSMYQECMGTLTERFVNILSNLSAIKSYNLYDWVISKYQDINEELAKISIKRIHKYAILVVWGLIFGLSILKVAFGSYLAIIGLITSGTIVAFLQLHNHVDVFFRNIGSFLTYTQQSRAAAERVFSILDNNKEFPQKIEVVPNSYALTFEGIQFSYSPENPVLKGVGFKVNQGEKVAIVGPSGSGKSTIFKLLLGFYSPNNGRILFNQALIPQCDLFTLRQQIAYVPQDGFLFHGTIAENIGYGKKNATQEEIIQAAKTTNAHEFIMRLEKGYQTVVGERGVNLSGGERQRIAIAAAMLKNSPILLLDEATSALDTKSEQLIQDALEKLMIGKTTLIIAHKMDSIKYVDKILYIEDGRIVEEGTHQELLDRRKFYFTMYNQQFT